MMNKLQNTDERMEALSGRIAFIFLGLTQVSLLGAILYRRMILGQSQDQFSDLRLILILSVFGYVAARLYYGAILPVLSLRILFIAYFGLTALLFIVLSLWLGLPSLDNWQNTILPVVIGPAILVGTYGVMAFLGKKRLDKEIINDEEND